MSDHRDDAAQHKPPPWAVGLAFGVVFLSWGTTYLATGIAMKDEHMPPALFGGVRLTCAGIIVLLIQLGRGQALRLSLGEYLRLLVISWFLFLSANFLIHWGQAKVDSGVSAVLIATTPLWMGLFGMFWPHGERLSWRGWLGLLVGFAGIMLTMAPQVGPRLFDDYHSFLILASAACWALGACCCRVT